MNLVLWVLQVLAALVYGASGVMKVFMFDKISKGVPLWVAKTLSVRPVSGSCAPAVAMMQASDPGL
jgi:hypothetical protein